LVWDWSEGSRHWPGDMWLPVQAYSKKLRTMRLGGGGEVEPIFDGSNWFGLF
jgi:hypothetical protein